MNYSATVPAAVECSRCDTRAYHVHIDDITDEGHFALWYALAFIGGPDSKAAQAFQKGVGKAAETLGRSELREALQRGLKELLEKGLLDAERSGEGELVPKLLHLKRLAEPQLFALA